jgi:CDP-diacylglycerol--serine O-phosphatidyltransferase
MRRKRRHLELRKTLFLLPNLITLSSIFCGFDSIRLSASAKDEGDFLRAAVLIVFAMFFDILDGRVARMTKTQSAFGVQIDSLADVVSFGVAPALLVYEWTLHRFGFAGLAAAFVFCACGAVRLARFNVLSMGEAGKPLKPSKFIVGLPIPGAAGILVAIIVANHAAGGVFGAAKYAWVILTVTLGLSTLMVSTVHFPSFKEVRLNAPTMLLVAFAIGSSALISTQFQPAFVLLWLMAVYVTIGVLESIWNFPARRRAREDARLAFDVPRESAPPPHT